MRVLVKRADSGESKDERVEFCRLNMLNDNDLYLRVIARVRSFFDQES